MFITHFYLINLGTKIKIKLAQISYDNNSI